jgi:hypothetical protein
VNGDPVEMEMVKEKRWFWERETKMVRNMRGDRGI